MVKGEGVQMPRRLNQSRKGVGFRVWGVGHLHGLVESIAKTVDRQDSQSLRQSIDKTVNR